MEYRKSSSNLVKWSLIVGIVILMNLFFNYALSLVYTAPAYNAYFPQSQVVSSNAEQQHFAVAQKNYDRSIFIALVALGALSIGAGSLIENTVLSVAFSWAGVLSLVIAAIRYWSDAGNLLKVIILAVALAGLIWTAVKKFA
jgi:hypothetical protein